MHNDTITLATINHNDEETIWFDGRAGETKESAFAGVSQVRRGMGDVDDL
jgi:hypothetical protein